MTSRGLITHSIAALIAIFAIPARADTFVPWVSAQCDPEHGRGTVRFGYADSDEPAYFRNLPAKLQHGLASRPPSRISIDEAACRYRHGAEIKVRVGNGYGGVNMPYSVWVAGVRVAHGIVDDKDELPLSLSVDARGVSACNLIVTGREADAMSSEAGATLPIACDTWRPIVGTKDLIEYPADGHIPPRPGTVLLVEANDQALCNRLLAGAHPRSLEAVADVPKQDAWQFIDTIEGLALSRLPEDPAFRRPSVYKIGSGGTWAYLGDRDYALLVPTGATEAGLRKFAAEAGRRDWKDVPDEARARGWQAVSSQNLGFAIENSSFEIGTRDDRFMVLIFSTTSDEQFGGRSALLQVTFDGSNRLLCRFYEVQKHF